MVRIKRFIKSTDTYNFLSKTFFYTRIRPIFGSLNIFETKYYDDSANLENDGVPAVLVDWPADIRKPLVGVIRDVGPAPRWTKYMRFLKNNGIPFELYDLHSHSWLDHASKFGVILGVVSSSPHYLDEQRRKFNVLEQHLGIMCYPTVFDLMLFEDKILEAFLSQVNGFPFIKTYVANDFNDAILQSRNFTFPLISKVVPGSGSVGVEIIRNAKQCKHIIKQAFSVNGRSTHTRYFRQKNYVYFQDYIENDGYDLRVIVVGQMVFGYYRKVLKGDFRASGMGLVEKRELPFEAMKIARYMYAKLDITMLVVDMLCDKNGRYHVIEFSPICRIDTPEQLHVKGQPGVYIFEDDLSYHFEKGRFWVHELALKRFFENTVI